jgi:Tol biopolymer transport system component
MSDATASALTGRQLGTYRVYESLGAGGMGEVYRARDMRLDRDVAIKVLPHAFTADADRLARFEREAKVLASLNHPNIAAIYGVEEGGGVPALVLELVEGPTLAQRIARGPVPLADALPVAKQIAEALEAAHDRGIVHRDLKPANIKVRSDSRVKVLDFGLAKAVTGDAPGADLGQAPTVTLDGTRPGQILGTPAYMSPEQTRGQAVDRRVDIWAFGCVLYEMLTGRRAFAGSSSSDLISAVLTREPDWNALPETTPAGVRRLLRRCLEKDVTRRLRDIGDARLEIEDLLTKRTDSGDEGRPVARRGWALVVVAAIIAGLAGGIGTWGWLRPVAPDPPVTARVPVTLPAGVRAARDLGVGSAVAVAPDGSSLVMVGIAGDGQRLYRRALDAIEATPIAGTEGASNPFFSPDGAWIGFFADGWLRRIQASGGSAVNIVEAADLPQGASWGPDDRIVFGASSRSPLLVVSARGGQAEPLTSLDTGSGHGFPDLLPDGNTLVFTVGERIDALDLRTGRRNSVTNGSSPRYLPGGYLVFGRGTTLLAAPFDPQRLDLTGPEVPLLEGVATDFGVVHYAISRTGTLAYVPGSGVHELLLVSADGSERLVTEERVSFRRPRFSPDGTRVAVGVSRGSGDDIWIYDLLAGTSSKLTFEGGTSPAWTPDGTAITFSAGPAFTAGQRTGIYSKRTDGRTPAELLVPLTQFHWVVDWTRDGTLAFGMVDDVSPRLGVVSGALIAFAGGQQRRVVERPWGGRLSPDGRWLAYASRDSGRFEVHVTPFPDGGAQWQITEDGGRDPAWSPDGTEVYYVSSGRLMAARLEISAGVRVLSRRMALEPFSSPNFDDYDLHRDGQTVVVVRPRSDPRQGDAVMALGWGHEVQRRLGR